MKKNLLVFFAGCITSLPASAQWMDNSSSFFDNLEFVVIIIIAVAVLIWIFWIRRILVTMQNISRIVAILGTLLNRKTQKYLSQTSLYMDVRGKTKEQKKIVKYFMSTGLLGMIFRISDSVFDTLLDSKAQEFASQIANRALEAHGMDADEVREIPPIFVEDYYKDSLYFKFFRDNTFRASEYQMSYLMFSEKQVYSYSYIFDLTSANTNEQTKEFFYEDISSIDIVKTQSDLLAPRPMEYIIGGIACLIIGLLLLIFTPAIGKFIGFLILLAGVYLTWFFGFSRRVVDGLNLRLTVPGDEFVCAMNPDNIEAIQGMKAKIREKKK